MRRNPHTNIDNRIDKANSEERSLAMHYAFEDLPFVPGGSGWSYATVALKPGDTAFNPASTKPERVIHGPAKVTYERSRAQIVAHVEDSDD
jgi:hypothetical protein